MDFFIANDLPGPNEIPALFRRYAWDANHFVFGWQADNFENGFPWIVSLEDRFQDVLERGETLDLSLIVELILWGGDQQGILGRFSRGLRTSRPIDDLLQDVVANLDRPREALKATLEIPSIGPAYGSKLLRFCRPSRFGALDNRIRRRLSAFIPEFSKKPVPWQIKTYNLFLGILDDYRERLKKLGISRPAYGLRLEGFEWKASEVEMAIFAWASE